MLAVHEPQEPARIPLTDREWSAASRVPPGVDRLLWLERTGGVVTYVMEDLDG